MVDEFGGVELGTYTLDGNGLKIKIPDPEDPKYVYTMWYEYIFLENDKKLYLENIINFEGDFIKQD